MCRIEGLVGLMFDAVEETTHLVERTHDAVVRRTVGRFTPSGPARTAAEGWSAAQRVVSGGIFSSVRGINRVVRLGAEAAIGVAHASTAARTADADGMPPSTMPPANTAGAAHRIMDGAQAAINGLWGDYLHRRSSSLDLGMSIRDRGRPLTLTRSAIGAAVDRPTSRICVFFHGLSSTERVWSVRSEAHYGTPDVTFGSRLRDDLDQTPFYVRYNSGQHISENGRLASALIADLLAAYPVPVEDISLIGHSMGGLVARSAASHGREDHEPWVDRLRHIVCIGSPHLGAPLEKAVHAVTGVLRRVEAAGSQVPGALLDTRSAGIRDLRRGFTIDEEWLDRDADAVFADARRRIPPVSGVGYYFVAARITRAPEHPVGELVGDLLVRVPSASGRAAEPARRIPFHDGVVLHGVNHVHLANHPGAYRAIRRWLEARRPPIG